ncbi:histidine kinase [Nonomuraea sp. NPDC046802]|uniref:sensor histidine kinase n=1 Tax=Nonomuraea sp. NPDC046802 TaxID=3154919 RepID=UPI0033C365E6
MNEAKVIAALRNLCAVAPLLFFGGTAYLSSMNSGTPIVSVLHGEISWDRDHLPPLLLRAGLWAVGMVLLRWRRRWPWQIAVATALLTLYSDMAAGPAYAAYASLSTHRRWGQIVPVALLTWLCPCLQMFWDRENDPQRIYSVTSVTLVTGLAIIGLITVLGFYLGERTDMAALRQQAELTAQLHRIEQTRLSERVKIAQEMHDVLAHRLSLLSMLAGGVAHRDNLTPEQTREATQAIQENAHQSLNELRTVLGSLRSDGAVEGPQPNLADLDALFEEVRAAGQHVEVHDTIEGRERLPTQTGRNAYRIVQEALTNARKHVPGSRVRAELSGSPGQGLWIRVSNPAPYGLTSGPGGRLGLVGLAERTRVAGGTLSHALQEGRFVLEARLPWEA